ncbi:MAG TPA: HD domain-containing protein [Gemmatimonadaceae bacterium]|nr:HD domain-containing protein [Gemmatimonadaceae bacterium]
MLRSSSGNPSVTPDASPEQIDRLRRQLALIVEADRLKLILRRTLVTGGGRHENSAEHSWHLALAAMTLAEHAGADVDAARALQLAIVHDLVEIDAGDTFAYDVAANLGRVERERLAADRIFGLLPPDQGRALRALWDEFEEGRTANALFAIALDRLLPLLLNDLTDGGSWRQHGVTKAQVLRRMAPIEKGIPALWPLVLEIVDRNCALGRITPD